MKTMRVTIDNNGNFVFVSKDTIKPVMCVVKDFELPENDQHLKFNVEWITKGKYTNGQCKKLLKRTIMKILRLAVENAKDVLKTQKV